MVKVVKRDGRKVNYDTERIVTAINKAIADAYRDRSNEIYELNIATKIADNITTTISNLGKKTIDVETIQDMVENKLMSIDPLTAKTYILYREERNKLRNSKTYQVFNSIVNVESNDITKENANMRTDTPAGMMMKFASETTKAFTDDCLISKDVRDAVDNNYIHIHDKDYYPTKSLTCLQHPLDRILNNGFRAGHGASRPAKRIETASIIGCISMESVQNEMHGGQAIPAFDFYLAPYVRKTYIEEVKKLAEYDEADYSDYYNYEIEDYLTNNENFPKVVRIAVNETVKRVHQAMEAFIHNMNTIHSRGGNQVVFSSINYGTDTSAEGRCIIREILKSTYNGVGNGETPIFPIQIWKLKEGVSAVEGDRNYDLLQLACKVTAKRFFPNFVNLDTPFNINDKWDTNDPERYKYEVAEMGCRTRVFENKHGEKTSIGRGNLSFTTINLVKIALDVRNIRDYDKKMKKFYAEFDRYIDLTVKQLKRRFDFQSTALKTQFPMLMSGLWNGSDKLSETDTIKDVISQGTLGVGFIGLAECLIALTGKHHGESEEAQKLGLEIIYHMKQRVDDWGAKLNLNYSVLATPAEGLSGRFTKNDKKKFGIIKGITDKDYYTNSNHVPVWYHCSIEHKASIEAPYHALTLGGHIFYAEFDGDVTHNEKAALKFVEIIRKHNIGYGAINHLRNRCLACGYENAEHNLKVCPKCGSDNIDVIERITGYLVGTTSQWNSGKKAELKDRVPHDV